MLICRLVSVLQERRLGFSAVSAGWLKEYLNIRWEVVLTLGSEGAD